MSGCLQFAPILQITSKLECTWLRSATPYTAGVEEKRTNLRLPPAHSHLPAPPAARARSSHHLSQLTLARLPLHVQHTTSARDLSTLGLYTEDHSNSGNSPGGSI